MTPHIRFGWSVGRSVCHNFLKRVREVSLLCSYRSTCFKMDKIFWLWRELSWLERFGDFQRDTSPIPLTHTGFPKKDARFQNWEIFLRYSAMICKVKSSNYGDFKYLSNRASFMGNPVLEFYLEAKRNIQVRLNVCYQPLHSKEHFLRCGEPLYSTFSLNTLP